MGYVARVEVAGIVLQYGHELRAKWEVLIVRNCKRKNRKTRRKEL